MVVQVADDIELLDLMIKDHNEAPDEYNATGRWLGYSERFLVYLKEKGLHDFRRQRPKKDDDGYVLASLGARDLNSASYGTPEELYHMANSCYLAEGARPIKCLHSSQVGNPEGFEIGGQFYTRSWLNYFCRYAYVSKFIKFKNQIVVEVGPGSGKQAELLKKAHPDLTILLFDLPTQLYVCNQYLSKVFSDTDPIVEYRKGREVERLDDVVPGKINILPNWKFDIIRDQPIDLLWSASCFQEMGLETAMHYLTLASKAKACFLMYQITYESSMVQPGKRGVIDPEVLYNFDEIDRTAAMLVYLHKNWLYFDSFWKNRLYA